MYVLVKRQWIIYFEDVSANVTFAIKTALNKKHEGISGNPQGRVQGLDLS